MRGKGEFFTGKNRDVPQKLSAKFP